MLVPKLMLTVLILISFATPVRAVDCTDAELLALEISGALLPPPAMVDQIDQDLASIYAVADRCIMLDKERRTIFLKYGQHGTVVPRTPGNNCAFYDLTDPRLSAPTLLCSPSVPCNPDRE